MNEEIIEKRNWIYFSKKQPTEDEVCAFLSRNEEEIIRSLEKDDQELLSLIALMENPEKKTLLQKLGKDGERRLSKLEARCLVKEERVGILKVALTDASSLYPLFGSGDGDGRSAVLDFPLVLLSLVKSGKIKKGGKFFSSSAYLQIFPTLEKTRLPYSSERALSSLESIGVVNLEGNVYVPGGNFKKFAFFHPLLQLSYIMKPSLDEKERERHLKALILVSLIKNAPAEGMKKIMRNITLISGFESSDIKDYLDYGLLDDEGTSFSGRALKENKNGFTISSDWRVLSEGMTESAVALFSNPIATDRVSIWEITKESLFSYFDLGYGDEDVISTLGKESVPSALSERIRSYYEEYSSFSPTRVLYLKLSGRAERLFERIEGIGNYIIEKAGDGRYIMDEERESEWRELVSKTLGDVLPRTKGPLFSTSTAPFISNVELPGIKALEDFRKYPYTPRSVSGKKVVSSLLSASGFLVGEKNADDAFPTADGFDYQMKMRILEKAEKERDEYAILIEDWNGRNALGLCDMLIKKEGDDKVIFLHKSIDVSTIYKLTLIPRAFL